MDKKWPEHDPDEDGNLVVLVHRNEDSSNPKYPPIIVCVIEAGEELFHLTPSRARKFAAVLERAARFCADSDYFREEV